MRFGVREMIFVLLLIGAMASSYFFAIQPLDRSVTELRRQKQQKIAKLEQLEAATRNIADLGKEIDKLGEAIDIFEQKLPAEREVEVILKQVWEMAAKHKLTPKSIRTDKPVPAAQYSELPIRMVIVGDFDGFYSFMLDLEKLKRITQVKQMQIKKLPNVEGQMQADMVLSIFFDAQDSNGKNDSGRGHL